MEIIEIVLFDWQNIHTFEKLEIDNVMYVCFKINYFSVNRLHDRLIISALQRNSWR